STGPANRARGRLRLLLCRGHGTSPADREATGMREAHRGFSRAAQLGLETAAGTLWATNGLRGTCDQCPLFPRKRTSIGASDMSVVPKADIRQSASQRCPRWHGRVRKRAQRIARRPLRQETTWNFLIKNLPPRPNTVSRFHTRRDVATEFGK